MKSHEDLPTMVLGSEKYSEKMRIRNCVRNVLTFNRVNVYIEKCSQNVTWGLRGST